jgi:hypothetical protein
MRCQQMFFINARRKLNAPTTHGGLLDFRRG